MVALFARFPGWRSPTESVPVIADDKAADFPELAADLAVLREEVAPVFVEYDLRALREQSRHRRQQVAMMLGAALLTGLGGIQAIVPGQRWPGIVLAVLGVALATSSSWTRERRSDSHYLTARIKAERLRALHFRYLSATGRYAGPERELELRRSVLAIKGGKELE